MPSDSAELPSAAAATAAGLDARRDDDDRLMIRLQEGDRTAFDAIVERHQGELFGYFLRSTRDAAGAEDLTQETLLKVYSQSWDYLPLGKFRGWMFRIAHNLLVDNVRRGKRDALVGAIKRRSPDPDRDPLAHLTDDWLPADLQASGRELRALVDGLLDGLPAEQRETFTLHHFHGLSLPEVADAFDVAVPTAKSRLRLAREKLREGLARHGVRGTEPE